MQRWERPRHRGRPVTTTKSQTSHPPSFSSTLLDAIYRSLDEDRGAGPATEQPHCLTVDAAATITEDRPSFHLASTTSRASSGGFSSSESDVVALPTPRLPNPVRTSDPPGRTATQSSPGGRSKETEGYARRFQASEFYGELRKTKPPVSPGARLVSFLTNLFAAAGKPKKPKTPPAADGNESGRCPASSCSRSSCLVTTTPSSRAKTPPSRSDGAAKRSLKFYAAGLLVGEEPLPPQEDVVVGQLPSSEAEEMKLAGMAAREVIMRRCRERIMGIEEEVEEDEDDGAWSCSSSELFELENLDTGYQLSELPIIARARDFLL